MLTRDNKPSLLSLLILGVSFPVFAAMAAWSLFSKSFFVVGGVFATTAAILTTLYLLLLHGDASDVQSLVWDDVGVAFKTLSGEYSYSWDDIELSVGLSLITLRTPCGTERQLTVDRYGRTNWQSFRRAVVAKKNGTAAAGAEKGQPSDRSGVPGDAPPVPGEGASMNECDSTAEPEAGGSSWFGGGGDGGFGGMFDGGGDGGGGGD